MRKLLSFLLPGDQRRELAADFRAELHSQARNLHLPGGLVASVAWLGFALDTDRRLHPEFPELIYFRLGLSVVALTLVAAIALERLTGSRRLRQRGLGWMYVLIGYIMFSTAFFTGRIANDPNYVSGLQIVVMLVVFVPFPRRATYSLYGLSTLIFIGSLLYYGADVSSDSAQYSMQNLFIATLLSVIMTFILDRYRFNIFSNHVQIVRKSQEVEEQMERVRALKEQQDGDYFLTANLIKPLIGNETTQTPNASVDFLLEQKKKFSFRHWQSEIGGDYLYADHVTLADSDYIVFMNGDAMGKSMQGAGGALVLGTVFRSLITRTQQSGLYAGRSPERWLKDAFVELQNVFVTFDGSMLVSAVLGLLEESTGMLYYINAEHPFTVLYRAGMATFLGDGTIQRKIGVISNDSRLRIQTHRLRPGDILLVGSDGRDDLLLSTDEVGRRSINEDEHLFLRVVERADANLDTVRKLLDQTGELTDDLSLVRIAFREDPPLSDERPPELADLEQRTVASLQNQAPPDSPEVQTALERLPDSIPLRVAIAKSASRAGKHALAGGQYQHLSKLEPENEQWLYRAMLSLKRRFAIERSASLLDSAVDFGERLRLRTVVHPLGLVHLADCYRLMGQLVRARQILEEARAHPEVRQAAERLAKLF